MEPKSLSNPWAIVQYKPKERAIRIGIFYSSNSIAQAISGFLAVGIDTLNQRGGLKSWQWVFIIEGAMPIFLSIPLYLLLLTFPEDSKSLSDRERHIAINRFGRGSTRKTDVTWDTKAFLRIMSRPSTYMFFVSYICIAITAVAQATFLPTILKSVNTPPSAPLMKFSTQKANLYTAIVNLVAVPLYWTYPYHSDWTRERMWHYIAPIACSIPCYAVWTSVSSANLGTPEGSPSNSSISHLAMYGVAFLGQLLLISQPVMLSYRSSTLYGAAEQAVGTSTAVAALSIASIIAPQMYPHSDSPYFLPGFSATLALLGLSIFSYLAIPYCLLVEAQARKRETGHALPIQALEDAERSQVSEAAMARIQELRIGDEGGKEGGGVGVRFVHDEEVGR
ncbi:hypothetical protein FQN50_006159 [Emmonsiellopsis sp. PD_5]|nr:hypothetical protein FQN50_006159 [Emmonsiellopsis sp. PD_5]